MASNNTRYSVKVDGVEIGFERATKQTAIEEASKQSSETRKAVEVVTQAGNVVFSLPAAKLRKPYVHGTPDTKVIDVDEALAALIGEGYVPCHRRPRKAATLLRNEGAEDSDEKFAVLLDNGDIAGYAPNQRAAGAIMKSLPSVVAA